MGASTPQQIHGLLREISETPGWKCEIEGHDGAAKITPPPGVSRPFKIHLTPNLNGGNLSRVQLLTRLARHGWDPGRAAAARSAARAKRIAVHATQAASIQAQIEAIDRDATMAAASASATVPKQGGGNGRAAFSDMTLADLEPLPFDAERAGRSPRPPVFVKITPAWASAMIAQDNKIRQDDGTLNRRVSVKRVEDYMSDMRNKLWKKIHQGYAVTKSGKILDGQHRLLAVQATGVTIYGWVFFDADEATFDVVDSGRPRTVADALHVDHEVNTLVLASVVRQFWIYSNYDEFEWAGLTKRCSATASRDILAKNPKLREALILVNSYTKLRKLMRVPPVTLGVYLALRAYPEGVEKMHEYLLGISTGNDANGDGLRGTDPRKRLHTLMEGMRDQGKKRDNRFHLGVFLKGWNLFNEGRGVTLLGLRIDERIPVAYTPDN